MQLEIRRHCQKLGTSLDDIKHHAPAIYPDVVFLLAIVFAMDAENQELRTQLKQYRWDQAIKGVPYT